MKIRTNTFTHHPEECEVEDDELVSRWPAVPRWQACVEVITKSVVFCRYVNHSSKLYETRLLPSWVVAIFDDTKSKAFMRKLRPLA